MGQLDEQLFSSPKSVHEECTKESFKERIMFFEASITPAGKAARISPSRSSDNSPVQVEAVSEEESPFASSELESLSDSLSSANGEVDGPSPSTPSEIIKRFERELAGQKADDIETKPLEKPRKGLASQRHLPASGLVSGGIKATCQLPSSFEMVNDFRKSEARPGFLKWSSTLEPIEKVSSINLYSCNELVFSQAHLSSLKPVFRSPGCIVGERPKLHLSNSIITENGILHYINVCSAASSWYLLKNLANPELDLIAISKNDNELSMFIVSDITTTLFKRSNYLLFCGLRVVGKFVGRSLCVCVGDKCIKALKAKHVEKKQKTKLLVDELEFELSCEIERDEWFESVRKLNLC